MPEDDSTVEERLAVRFIREFEDVVHVERLLLVSLGELGTDAWMPGRGAGTGCEPSIPPWWVLEGHQLITGVRQRVQRYEGALLPHG